ncbi:hypothetical protein FB451DRAFT_1363901 [Mycena latifolia]|nr:hypothetical protein FB451DRAFT_1363901 [Mycena latifolia]
MCLLSTLTEALLHIFAQSAESIRQLLKGPRAIAANVVYLEGEEHRFSVRDGGKEWSVYGSPANYTPIPGGWAFGYKYENAEASRCRLTHGPPHDVLDLTIRKERAGCPPLCMPSGPQAQTARIWSYSRSAGIVSPCLRDRISRAECTECDAA